jgi:hypothetical protein
MVEEEVKRKREEEEMRLRLSLQEAQHMKEVELLFISNNYPILFS